jgi:hypothetical protein
VKPLGVVGPGHGTGWQISRDVLMPLVDQLDVETRRHVSEYLRQGTIIAARGGRTRLDAGERLDAT